jgi:hypothetical protein
MILHKHHIIPKHTGGGDDPSNIILLTIDQHAETHKQLYLDEGRKGDWLAWQGLSGQIGKEEILNIIYTENGKRWGKSNKGAVPWNKGKTKETDKRISDSLRGVSKSEEHKKALRKPKSNSEKMGKYVRTEEIRENLRAESKRIQQNRTEEEKQKINNTLRKKYACKCCIGFITNKSNLTQHYKNKHPGFIYSY